MLKFKLKIAIKTASLKLEDEENYKKNLMFFFQKNIFLFFNL